MKKNFSLLIVLSIIFSMLPSMASAGELSFDLITGSITIENGTGDDTIKVIQEGGETIDIISSSTVINIAQTNAGTPTENRIVVKANVSGGVNIMLSGVNIENSFGSSYPVFEINNTAGKVNLILADGSSNSLKSVAFNYAGLQKRNATKGADGLLTISCESASESGHICDDACGKLIVAGGSGAAGIGGGDNGGSGSYINIYGGNINAIGGARAAGIGGGNDGGSGTYINIYGGNIKATGDSGGAGIGGGSWAGSGSNITIEGGIVDATGDNGGAGIGGGSGYYSSEKGVTYGEARNITISGGTVTALAKTSYSTLGCGIGGGGSGFSVGSGINIKITGGNINASSIGKPDMPPVNNSDTPVYKATFTIPDDALGGTTLDAISFNIDNIPYSYNMNDTISILDDVDGAGKLFVYLPVGTYNTEYSGKAYTAVVDTSGDTQFTEKPLLREIMITTPPDKTVYKSGETFSKEGMVVKATYDNGIEDTNFTAYTVDKTGPLTISDTTVTLTANENASITTTLNIAVNKTDSGGGSGGKSGGSGNNNTVPPAPTPVITVTEVKSELFTKTEDIVVEADVESAFGQPVEVKITDDEESKNEVFSLAGADDEVYPFDISLYSKASGEKVQPKEGYSVKITLPIPEKLLVVRDQVKVVYVRDGKLEVLSSQVVEKDGKWYITFEAVHFSPYALIVNKEPADTWTNPFSDVKEGSWYYSAVQYVAQNGLMFGTGSDTFSPQLTTNRGMIATILYRLSGSPETLESTFKDVVPGAYYTQGVAWAQEKGIIAGYGNGMFGPEDSITREQMAAILWRYAGSPKADTTVLNDFNDAGEISDYARQAMAWVYEEGIIAGKGNRILDPRGLATRAEAAMILTNYLKAK